MSALLEHDSTMRALVTRDQTGTATLEVAEVPAPAASALGDAEVLVEVRAAGLTYPDVLLSSGKYQVRPELPFSPGLEVAGVVLAAGPQSGAREGERVAALLTHGGLAGRVVTEGHLTATIPDELDFCEGAALVVNYRTALYALTHRGRVVAGETCLVHGAGGGLGLAVVQVAAALGARVIAVTSDAHKAQVARDAGAAVVVGTDNWADDVRAHVVGGPDLILDPVGGDRFEQSLRLLDDHGRIVILGFTEGTIPSVAANRLLFRNIDVIGAALGAFVARHPEGAPAISAAVNALAAEQGLRPLIAQRIGISQAAAALGDMEHRRGAGKIVVDMTL